MLIEITNAILNHYLKDLTIENVNMSYNILHRLSQVNRFDMIVMFLGEKEKKGFIFFDKILI